MNRTRIIDGGCWEWLGHKYSNGYGSMSLRHGATVKHLLAHRVSYECFVGPIAHGKLVLHSCDNKSCVNPGHLFVGTQQDNVNDYIRKGRAPDRRVFGEQNGKSKLSVNKVLLMRRMREKFKMSWAALAKQFHIAPSSARKVCLREHWGWVL